VPQFYDVLKLMMTICRLEAQSRAKHSLLRCQTVTIHPLPQRDLNRMIRPVFALEPVLALEPEIALLNL
jgi:hypothetical protein